MTTYAQTDGRWAGLLLGYNDAKPWTISNYGCYVTAWANLVAVAVPGITFTPADANRWLQSHDGFDPGGGLLRWRVAEQIRPDVIIPSGDVGSLSELNAWLQDAPNYAIVHFYDATRGHHYCLATAVNTIQDSWDGKQKGLNAYTFLGAKKYRVVSPQAAPVPVTVTTPTVAEAVTAPTFTLDGVTRDATGWARAWSELKSQFDQVKPLADQVPALLAQVEELRPDFEDTYLDTDRVRVVVGNHTMADYAGKGEDYQLLDGMLFRQAGTFIIGGRTLSRSIHSVANGDWYGAEQDWFADSPEERGVDKAHLATSMVIGLVSKLNPFRLFKKKG
jgi:hypothetical protein